MKITNIIAIREVIEPDFINSTKPLAQLALYNQDNILIKKSDPINFKSTTSVEYEGLVFVSFYNKEIYITLDSLQKVINISQKS